jgi:hypothetical protein
MSREWQLQRHSPLISRLVSIEIGDAPHCGSSHGQLISEPLKYSCSNKKLGGIAPRSTIYDTGTKVTNSQR